MKIYIGADHRGYALKETLKQWLSAAGYEVTDCGNTVHDPDDDFPDFSLAVADAVAADPESRGIVICGSGGGVTMAANKVRGIRCGQAVNTDDVRHNRQHDDMNVLALGSDYITEQAAREMTDVFLKTPFDGGGRFVRRLEKIAARER